MKSLHNQVVDTPVEVPVAGTDVLALVATFLLRHQVLGLDQERFWLESGSEVTSVVFAWDSALVKASEGFGAGASTESMPGGNRGLWKGSGADENADLIPDQIPPAALFGSLQV